MNADPSTCPRNDERHREHVYQILDRSGPLGRRRGLRGARVTEQLVVRSVKAGGDEPVEAGGVGSDSEVSTGVAVDIEGWAEESAGGSEEVG